MQYQKVSSTNYCIRIARGENIVDSLKKFCKKEKVSGGFFYGIGAVDKVELAHYDVAHKKYSKKIFEGAYEVPNITGTVGVSEKDLIIHAHATFTDEAMNPIGGHLVDARVSGTAEIFLTKTASLKKKFNEETGLKLFELDQDLS